MCYIPLITYLWVNERSGRAQVSPTKTTAAHLLKLKLKLSWTTKAAGRGVAVCVYIYIYNIDIYIYIYTYTYVYIYMQTPRRFASRGLLPVW